MCLLHNSFSKVKLIFWWRRVFVENNRVKHCYPVGYGNDFLYYPKSSPKCPNSTRTRDEFVVLPKAFHQNRYSPRISPPEIPNNFPTVNQNLPKIASEEVIFRAFLPILPENWGCATATDVICCLYSCFYIKQNLMVQNQYLHWKRNHRFWIFLLLTKQL